MFTRVSAIDRKTCEEIEQMTETLKELSALKVTPNRLLSACVLRGWPQLKEELENAISAKTL